MLADKAAVADVLLKCFGQDGDITIVVMAGPSERRQTEEKPEQAVEGAPSQFKVWSKLLSEWSDVFAAMFKHGYQESVSSRIVIEDFSVASVEAFLRFLYSGVLDITGNTLIEVAGLADKYCVPRLQALCANGVKAEVTPQNASKLFETASQIGAAAARQYCLETMTLHAAESLPHAWHLKPALVDEVLGSPLLCIAEHALTTILLNWTSKRMEEDVGDLIKRHVQVAALSEDEYAKVLSLAAEMGHAEVLEGMRRLSRRGENTNDVFSSLWQRYDKAFPDKKESQYSDVMRPPFLGFWINLIPNTASFYKVAVSGKREMTTNYSCRQQCSKECFIPRHFDAVGGLQSMAANRLEVPLQQGMAMTWILPHHAVYVTGIGFANALREKSRIQVHASVDGTSWQLLVDASSPSSNATTSTSSFTPCRYKDCVRWFKLTVCKGRYDNRLCVHGVLQDM